MRWVFANSMTEGIPILPPAIVRYCATLALHSPILCLMQTPADHSVKPLGIEYIELAGDKKATEEWMGTDKLPLRWVEGQPGIKAVGIKTESGTIVLK